MKAKVLFFYSKQISCLGTVLFGFTYFLHSVHSFHMSKIVRKRTILYFHRDVNFQRDVKLLLLFIYSVAVLVYFFLIHSFLILDLTK
jgi:hypothetical protein